MDGNKVSVIVYFYVIFMVNFCHLILDYAQQKKKKKKIKNKKFF